MHTSNNSANKYLRWKRLVNSNIICLPNNVCSFVLLFINRRKSIICLTFTCAFPVCSVIVFFCSHNSWSWKCWQLELTSVLLVHHHFPFSLGSSDRRSDILDVCTMIHVWFDAFLIFRNANKSEILWRDTIVFILLISMHMENGWKFREMNSGFSIT